DWLGRVGCTREIWGGWGKPLSTIREPTAASARAMPRPIPEVEPVTSDTFPISVCPLVVIGCLMAMFMADRLPLARETRPAGGRDGAGIGRGGSGLENADWLTR